MAQWTTVLDASGHESDQDYLVVGGYIARAKDWIEFEKVWLERIGKDGLTYYHHTEHSRRYPDLVRDLVPIIPGHTWYKFACCVPKASLAVLPQTLQSHFRLVAYSLAGRTVVGAVREWLLKRDTPEDPVEFVFEAGDIKRGLLIQRLKDDRYPEPLFIPGKRDLILPSGILQPAFVPLQAADLLAGEVFRLERDKLHEDPPELFRALDRTVQGVPTTWTTENAESLRDVLNDYTWWRRFTDFL
jgi:hypothetical protein